MHTTAAPDGRRAGATWVAATGAFLLVAAAAVFIAVRWDTLPEAERDLLDAVAAGAQGYLVKSTPPDELRTALWRAANGEPVFSPALAALVLGEFRRMSRTEGSTDPLSPREREVLQYVARGHTYREIGEQLFIAEKTVENHVRNIMGKLHLNRRQELVRYALEHGIE